MLKKWCLTLMLVAVVLGGCKRGSEKAPAPTPTPTPAGKTETLNLRVTYPIKQASMLNTYLEAKVYASTDPSLALGTVTDKESNHTKGLTSQKNYRVSVNQVEPSKVYVLSVSVFNNESKSVLLYRGRCTNQAECNVLTQNNPSRAEVTFEPATDAETIYQNSVPEEYRKQCAIQPDETICGRAANRVYYDQAANTCKRFSWGGCGEVTPYNNMAVCQQACIR